MKNIKSAVLSSSSRSSQSYSLEDMRNVLRSVQHRNTPSVVIMETILQEDDDGLEKERAALFPFFLFLIKQNGGKVEVEGKPVPTDAKRYIKLAKDKDFIARYEWYIEQFLYQVHHNINTLQGKKVVSLTTVRKQYGGSGFGLAVVSELGSYASKSFVSYQYATISKHILEISALTITSARDIVHQYSMWFIILSAAYMIGTFLLRNKHLNIEARKVENEKSRLQNEELKLALDFYEKQRQTMALTIEEKPAETPAVLSKSQRRRTTVRTPRTQRTPR